MEKGKEREGKALGRIVQSLNFILNPCIYIYAQKAKNRDYHKHAYKTMEISCMISLSNPLPKFSLRHFSLNVNYTGVPNMQHC